MSAAPLPRSPIVPRRVAVGALASLLVLVAVLGALAFWAWRAHPTPVADPVSAAPNPSRIGDDVALTATLSLPWKVHPIGKPLLQRAPAAPAAMPTAPAAGAADAPKPAAVATPVALSEELQTLSATVTRGRPGLPSWQWQVQVDLQPLDFGPFANLELVIPLGGTRPGEPTALHLPIPTLEVVSGFPELEGAPTQKGDLQPKAEEAAAASRRTWLWVALASAALLVLALCLWWWRRRQREGVRETPLPPPADEALEALTALEAALPLPGEVYFTRLQDIVRRFIERRYGLPVHAATTPEFLRAVNQPRSPLNLEVRQALAEMLQVGDQVRFALGEANSETFTAGLATARTLVADAQRQAEAAAATVAGQGSETQDREESQVRELEDVLESLAPPVAVRADQELAAEEDWRPPGFATAATAAATSADPVPETEADPEAPDAAKGEPTP